MVNSTSDATAVALPQATRIAPSCSMVMAMITTIIWQGQKNNTPKTGVLAQFPCTPKGGSPPCENSLWLRPARVALRIITIMLSMCLQEKMYNRAGLQTVYDVAKKNADDIRAAHDKLVDEINASNKYIQQLVEAKSKSDSLNVALTNNLTRSLSREELKDVDIQVLKGVVYISLNDNMLYKSGSYEISTKAGETLSKIAKIITDYDDYEVLVEGNTDNVPISRTNIRNNWDLSALRASSVVQELQNKYGVNPSRLSAAGRGEYNTVADNATAEGRAKNRRTQIIITPKLDQFLELIDKAPATEETETVQSAE
jgi:chemotaxis protein MotB